MKFSLSLQTASITDVSETDDEGDSIEIFLPEAATEDYLLHDGAHPLLVDEQLLQEQLQDEFVP